MLFFLFQWVMNSIDSNLSTAAGELYRSVRSKLWSALESMIQLLNCEIYRYTFCIFNRIVSSFISSTAFIIYLFLFFLATILIWCLIRFAKMEPCGHSTISSTIENSNVLFSLHIEPWSEYFFFTANNTNTLNFIWNLFLLFFFLSLVLCTLLT